MATASAAQTFAEQGGEDAKRQGTLEEALGEEPESKQQPHKCYIYIFL